MADLPPRPDPDGDAGAGPDRGSTAGTPRWVTAFGIVALVLVLLFVILLFTKGPHRPGRHMASGGVGDYAPPIGVTAVHAPSGAGPGVLATSEGGRG